MSGDLIRKGIPQPERWWRSRAERQALRQARLRGELEQIRATSDVEAARIRAAGRAQVHHDRLRYTATLTAAAGQEYADTVEDIEQQMSQRPADQMLNVGLAEILGAGLQAFKGEIAQHQRDGRELGL